MADIGAGTGCWGSSRQSSARARCICTKRRKWRASRAGGCSRQTAPRSASSCRAIRRRWQDPPRADVVVSETLGNYALEENIIATLADARVRHLKDGGVIIPARISSSWRLWSSDRIHRELTVWDEVGFGIDLAPASAMSLNNVYVRTLESGDLLDGGEARQAWDDGRSRSRERSRTARAR